MFRQRGMWQCSITGGPVGMTLGKSGKGVGRSSRDNLMSEPLAAADFPGPKGLPFLGNIRAVDLSAGLRAGGKFL